MNLHKILTDEKVIALIGLVALAVVDAVLNKNGKSISE